MLSSNFRFRHLKAIYLATTTSRPRCQTANLIVSIFIIFKKSDEVEAVHSSPTVRTNAFCQRQIIDMLLRGGDSNRRYPLEDSAVVSKSLPYIRSLPFIQYLRFKNFSRRGLGRVKGFGISCVVKIVAGFDENTEIYLDLQRGRSCSLLDV